MVNASSACVPSAAAPAAAAGHSQEKRSAPCVFGCTYTTGSSVPAVFPPAGGRSTSSTSSTPSCAAVSDSASPSLSTLVADFLPPTSGTTTLTAFSFSRETQKKEEEEEDVIANCPIRRSGNDTTSRTTTTRTRTATPATAATAAPVATETPVMTAARATAASTAAASKTAREAAAPTPGAPVGTAGPACAIEAVLQDSAPVPSEALIATGWNFEEELTLQRFLEKSLYCGFQATQLGRAILEVQRMQQWRLSHEPVAAGDLGTEWECLEKRRETRCCIWLSFTSNMISSGLREVFLFLCKHRLVDVLVTSAGGVEEDFIKALGPTIIGDFSLPGNHLREKGWNRIGNLLVPNHNYCLFEDWLQPILDTMLQEQQERFHTAFRQYVQEEQSSNPTYLGSCRGKKAEDTKKISPSKEMQQQEKPLLQTQQPQQQEVEQQQKVLVNKPPQQNKVLPQQEQQLIAEQQVKKGRPEKGQETQKESEFRCLEEKKGRETNEEVEYSTKKKPEKDLFSWNTETCSSSLMRAMSDAAWGPSEVIARLGKEINNEESVFYWCWKHNIPVFCPGLTDGSLGDNLFFHTYRKKGLVIDIVKDIRKINDIALKCKKSGIIILGGGLPKHHTCNANLMRNGADFAVYINTGVEYDGSDSGARPDEAVSWGKITTEAQPVKVHGDATIIFPLLVAATFAKEFHKRKNSATTTTTTNGT